mgnify:CR=1 FL=1
MEYTEMINNKLTLALDLVDAQKKAIEKLKEHNFNMHKLINIWLELLANDEVEKVMKSMERRLNDYRTLHPNDVL